MVGRHLIVRGMQCSTFATTLAAGVARRATSSGGVTLIVVWFQISEGKVSYFSILDQST